jgi:hypothetical protein
VIDLHGAALSQGQATSAAFDALSSSDQQAMVLFLNSLGRAAFDGDGDGDVDLQDFYGINGLLACRGSGVPPDVACAVHDLDADGDVDLVDAEAFAMDYDGGWYDCDDNGTHDLVQIAGDPALDLDLDGELDACNDCPADIDGSGDVDTDDLLTILAQWGPCAGGCAGDIDGNFTVDIDDLLLLVGTWGLCE